MIMMTRSNSKVKKQLPKIITQILEERLIDSQKRVHTLVMELNDIKVVVLDQAAVIRYLEKRLEQK